MVQFKRSILTAATRDNGMTAPHLKLKEDSPTETPMILDCTPFLTLTIIAVLMPNAAQAARVARRVAIVVIWI
jgi:hypothetical protein